MGAHTALKNCPVWSDTVVLKVKKWKRLNRSQHPWPKREPKETEALPGAHGNGMKMTKQGKTVRMQKVTVKEPLVRTELQLKREEHHWVSRKAA